jgi:hypothetical protein
MFEYLLPDGTALPENEVIKLAIQKGLTKEDYVKRNKLSLRPKQKKTPAKPDRILENINKYNVPKTVGPKEKKYEPVVLGKQESVGDYLTGALRTEKSVAKTFSVEEEEGKKVLEKLYAGIPGLTFEETTAASFGDITNMFDAVKAVYIDPVTGKKIESVPLQFDINVMNASEKERPKLVKANADILKDFFNKNLKNVDLGKNKYLKGLAELEYNKEINNAITPEFRAKVDEEFDAPDLFAPRKEQKVSMAATGQAAMGGTGYTTTIVKPYENELKRSKLKVLADNPGISQKDLDIQADKLTRTLLKTKAFNEQKSLVAENVINNNPDMQSTLYVGSLLANQAAVKVQNKNIVKLELAKKNASTINGLASDCKAILEGKYKTEDEAIAIANKFASLGIQMDQTQTELVTLKNGNQVSKGFFDAYNKLKEEYSANNLYAQNVLKEQADNLQKLEDSDIFASAASKNYDLSEKYLGTIGLGFSDLMVGGGYFASKVLDKVTPFSYAGNAVSKMIYGDEAETSSERLDKWAVGYTKAVTDIRDSYTRDVSFDDAFTTPSNFGKFAAQEISTQIPILTAMIATGGIAGGSATMIGVTSAGSKMADMQTEIARGSTDYSAPEIWLKSIGYGASEIAFESLTTIPILKRAKIALGKGGAEDVIDNGMRAYFKSKTPGFVFDQFLEAAGETGTQVTQNIIDGNPLMQNVDHAAFSGFAMGTVMSGVPYTHGLYLSAFSDYNSKNNIRKLQKEQSALGKQFEVATKKSQKKAISSLMTQKDAEITAAIEKQQKLVNNNLRAGVAENVIKIESKKAELQNEAKDILDNKDISTEVKDLLIQDLRGKFNKLNSIKQNALDPVNMMQDISKFVVLEASDPQRYEDLISRATVSLSSTLKPSEDNIKKTAYDLYLKEEIDTNINNASKVGGANLKVYNTKKEALAAVRNDENISDADKATIIEEVSLGADGYADAANQTQVVIKENMFNNQRTQIASHEIGHYVFDKIFASNPEAFIPIANQLLETTKKIDKKLYDKLVKDTERGDDNKLKATEVVSRFLELVSKDDISFAEKSDGFLSGLFGSMVQRQFAKQYDFDFKGQTDMFNFVVGLGKKIKSGELTLKEIEAASESKVVEQAGNLAKTKTYGKISTSDITPTAFSKAAVEEIQKKIDKLEEQYDNDQIEYDYYENQIKLYEEQLEKAKLQPEVEKPKTEKPKAVATEEEVVKEIIKNEKGAISSDKVQQIYNTKGTAGADEIIKLFKPITAKIVDKRRDAPGFDKELLTDEIESGKGGILDLIMKYDPKGGVPLAAYINKYLPVRAITSSRRVLDSNFTSDVETEVNVKATETADQGMTVNAPEKPKYKNALESNILEPNVLDSATKKIISTVRLLKNRIDAPVTLNRTVTPLIAEIRDEIGKQLDIDIKTMLGGKKDGVLRSQLLKAKRYILENMTTTWLMGKDGQGGIPQAIQKQIDGKWVSFPDWVGKKIDRETMSTDLAGRTSGAELVRRLPNVFNNVSNEEFLAQIIGPDGNPIRGRKESVSKAMAEEIAFDIINADLAERGPIFEAFTANQERLGVEVLENLPVVFAKQADRGNIKLSISKKLSMLPSDVQEYFFSDENYNSVINDLTNINAGNFPPKASYIKDVFNNIYSTDKISANDLDEIANDFSTYLNKFKVLPLKKLNSAEEKQFLSDYIKKSAEVGGNSLEGFVEDIQKIGEKKRTVTDLFKDSAALKDMYNTLDNFVSSIKSNPKSSEWYRMLGNFLATQAQIGDDTFITKDGLLLKTKGSIFAMQEREGGPRPKINKTTGEIGEKGFSYQPFSDKRSFWNFIKDALNIKKLPAGYNRNLKTNEADSASELYKNRSNAEYLENKKSTTKANREFLYELLDFMYNPSNGVNDETKAMIWASLNSSVESPLRKSGMVKWVFFDDNKSYEGVKLVYEHLTSVNKKKFELHNLFSSNVNNKKEAFNKLMEDYNVAVIPKSMDDEITNSGFKTEPLKGDQSEGGRYYNILTAGIKELFYLEALDKNAKQQTLGEEFVKAVRNFDYENAQKIAAVAYSTKFSKTPKGISVFDFDDTVGITSGSVLYTMPGDLMVYHGAPKGKNVTKISNKGVRFFATDKREADEYARMNSGVTQEFLINDSDLVREDIIIEKINELGLKPKNKEFEVEDASFYELIDTRFDESLSKADITKLFDALKKDGIKAISYSDGAQVSGRSTTSIAVIDPSIIAPPKKLNAEEFAKNGSKLLEDGAIFDFSEFSKVVDGKPGPMVQKMKKMIGKFGPDNFFILTARPADAAGPIHEFLKSIDINIPLENITGLGNSTAQAKADWITNKAADGYNDFYFADDATQNVEAVKKALEVPGITSKVQQAKLKFSLTTKQALKWELDEDGHNALFTVGGRRYYMSLIDTGVISYDDKTLSALYEIIEQNDLDMDAVLSAKDGSSLNLEFLDRNKGQGITDKGNAFKVISIVANGMMDRVKDKGIETLVFTAKEPSRIKLYNALSTVFSAKLGWDAYFKDGVYVLTKNEDNIVATTGINSLKPVKDVLNVVDVKSPRQQEKLKFSKTISSNFNKILEENVGVKAEETFSAIVAKRKGKAIGKYRFFVPPSAADLELLIYDFLGYGETGERQQQFFNKALFEPYANGIALIDAAKQSIKNDYKALLKAFPEVSKELGKLTPDGNFTYDQAIRVSMWAGMGEEVPGISEDEVKELNMFVNQNPDLAAFKAGLIATGRQDVGWVAPTEYWDSESIVSDLHNITDKVGRKKYLAEFIENSKEMFSKENLNKIEAIYGSNFRDALEDSIYSMANGTNRESGPGRINAAWLNWINNSTGAIMFWNTRSAVLQTIGSINYLNWRDNNPLNAAKAFANQPQYWKDFAYIWNSDKMKERRSGLKEDVSSSEIANAAAGTTSKANAIISYLLKKGFLPTQIGDSFAIASGGAAFYRNRINYNLKQGMTEAEAEAEAWKEFLKVTDQTQQSGDPRDISQQQRSAAGRLVLAFQNTSMQQARLVKKAGLDLVNRRGDAKTNISKIVYYTAVQNIIFGALQSALFATIFSDDDDEEKEKKKQTAKDKWLDIGNNVVDTILRGSGMAGAIVATLKNVYLKYNEESEKGFKAEYAKVLIEAANVAPAIGSKISKGFGAMRTKEFEKDVIAKRGWSVTADGKLNLSPSYSVLGQGIEATTNLPANRFVNKVNNLSEALDSRNKSWQRIALAVGYTPYTVGVKNEENETIKAEAKVFRKQEGLRKAEETRTMTRDSLNRLSPEDFKAYVLKKKNERLAEKDSINNLPKAQLDKYLKQKEASRLFSEKQKEVLEEIKRDSINSLSIEEYFKYLDAVENKKEIAKINRMLDKLKKERKRNIYK